jgi:hypothetical protein
MFCYLPGEQIHDMDVDSRTDKIYATGEYHYLVNDSEGNGDQIEYEDDVIHIISNINYTDKDNLGSYSVNDSRSNNI